jgi:hypothetical protein
MGVMKEWYCAGHGEFEAEEPVCPSGCKGSFITREFRSAPGYKSVKTKFTDQGMRTIANDYGLTDMSNRHGRSVMENQRKPKQEVAPSWKSDQIQHAAPGFSQRGEKAPTVNFSGLGLARPPGESFTANKMPSPNTFAHFVHKPYRPRKGMAILSESQRHKT